MPPPSRYTPTNPVRGWGDLAAVIPTMAHSRHPDAPGPIPEHPRTQPYADIVAHLTTAAPGLVWAPSPTASHPDAVRASLAPGVDANGIIPPECRRADGIAMFTEAARIGRLRGVPWVLVIEDDAWLGPDFRLVPILIAEAEARVGPSLAVVSFFTRRTEHDATGMHPIPVSALSGTVCMAIRVAALTDGATSSAHTLKGAPVDRFATFASRWYADTKHVHATDLLLGAWLQRGRADRWKAVVWTPCVVQHREGPSTFSHRADCRIAETYRRRYGEAPPYG